MGLKCTLLGHSFDETDVEREREERGSEVVTIVQEVERCSRCGTTRVVSENKEVTSIVDPDEVGVDEEPTERTAPGNATADAGGSSGYESGSDLDEFEPTDDPEEEDAEILSDDDRPADRQPGQWPGDEDEWSPDDLTGPGGADGDDAADARADESDGEPDDDGPPLAAGAAEAGTFVCDECGFEADAQDSPYRAGDACPECQAGYLRGGGAE